MTDFIYRGAIENLEKIEIEKPLVFTGKSSYEKIRPIIEKYIKNPCYYNNFSTNPKLDEIENAVNNISFTPDTIIAIGGGSVIDFAKVYRHKTKNVKFIAIPTTSGTGSEATQFAVYYENGKKCSLDEESLLPDYAIVDSQFTENSPKYIKVCTALDAYCQGIESYFACKSTEKSRNYAKQAIELCRDNIINYVNSNNENTSLNMAIASNLAGKAINISRTTAAHAMSYSITTKYGIPHGHAVALNIGKLLEYNKNVDEKTINDPRGTEFVKTRIKEIYDIIGMNNAVDYFNNLFNKIGIEYKEYKIDYIDSNRLKNNPRKIEKMEMNNEGIKR